MRRTILAFGAMILLMTQTKAQQGPTLTLQQSIETAIKNNFDIKQDEFRAQTAHVTYRQAKADMLPDIFGSATQGINRGRGIDPSTNTFVTEPISFGNYNLNANLTLFNGFQLLNNMKAQALNYDAAKAELQQRKDDITLNVILAYLQILNTSDQLQQQEKQAEVSRKQVERLELLNSQGAIPPSQLYDLKGQLATDQLAIVTSKNALEQAKLELVQLMNVPYDKNLSVAPLTADQMSLVYEAEVEAIFQLAMSQMGVMKAADYRRRSAERAVKAAKGGYSPNIFFSGNLNSYYSSGAADLTPISFKEITTSDFITVSGTQYNVVTQQVEKFAIDKISFRTQFKDNYNSSVAIGIRIPILNSFVARNNVARAKITHKTAEFFAKSAEITLRQNIERAYLNMKAAQDRVRVLREQVAAFGESFRIAEVRFNAGLGTSVDYLLARNRLDRAEIDLVIARYDYVIRTKVLDYYQGKPMW
jgi:outer membrane protein